MGKRPAEKARSYVNALATVFVLFATVACGFAQGTLNFANTSSTLISANGSPMPVSGEQRFYFALFLAPGNTVDTPGLTPALTDPRFQVVEAYNTNHAVGPGRLVRYPNVVARYPAGSTVDFVVRGWSANAGTTWPEALANWNNGSPLQPMFIGSSLVGNNFFLSGGTLPVSEVFGLNSDQVPGFNMTFIPEPSALALTVLGGTALWASTRHRKREPT